jgi:membrane protease YdiL (CAAX protease family)
VKVSGLAAPLTLAALGSVHIAAASALVPSVWWRMSLVYLLLAPLALGRVRLDWRSLFAPSVPLVARGVLAGVVLYGLGAVVFRLLRLVPGFAAEIATVESWRNSARPEVSIPLLVFIVLGEEVVWRAAVTVPLAARLGRWTGAVVGAAAFAVAHVGMGLGLLVLLAFPAGLFWNLLVVETGSAVPALVCHLLCDVAALFVLPY